MDYKQFEGHTVKPDGTVISHSGWRGRKDNILIPTIDKYGYAKVRIGSARKRYFVHRLVAYCYLPPCPDKYNQIRHLDGNKLNNHYSNLAWGNAKENAEDRNIHGTTSRGRRHSENIKSRIRGLYKTVEYNGESHTLEGWSKKVGGSPNLMHMRIKSGMSVIQAITTPVKKRRPKTKSYELQ